MVTCARSDAGSRDLAVGFTSNQAGRDVRPSRSSSAAPVPPVLIHDPLERGNGGGGRRERTGLVAHVPCLLAVGGIAQHRPHSCADHRGVALGWPDNVADPEGLAAAGAVGLIAHDRQDDQRNALGECFFDAVEAAV
jgi:hypothetical protein